jgi:hypothetical protein
MTEATMDIGQHNQTDTVVRDYVVFGPSGDLVVTDVAELEVGSQGELILLDAARGCAAIVAADHWWHVSPAPYEADLVEGGEDAGA